MKRVLCIILIISISLLPLYGIAEEEKGGLFGWISNAVDDASNWVDGAYNDAAAWTENAAADAWNWTQGAADDAWNWTQGAADDAWNWTQGAADDAWNWTQGAANDAWNWTQGAANDAWNWTQSAASDAYGWSIVAANDAWGWMVGAAIDISAWTVVASNDVWNWTKVAANDAWTWTESAAIDGWNWAKDTAVSTWKTTTRKIAGTWNDIWGIPDPRTPKGLCVDMPLLACAKLNDTIEANSTVTECYTLDDRFEITVITMARPDSVVPPSIGEIQSADLIASLFDDTTYMDGPLHGAGHRAMAQQMDLLALRDNRALMGKTLTVWTDHYIATAIITADSINDPAIKQENEDIMTLWAETISIYEVYEDDDDAKSLNTSAKSSIALSKRREVYRSEPHRVINEMKFHARQGHGFAAESANDLCDRIKGVFIGEKAKIPAHNNVPNGPDRIILKNNQQTLIQTKYCKNAKASINACFDKNGFRYYVDSEKNKPMLIEVPADQYDDAIVEMAEKIRAGKVKGVTDPNDAKLYVKKGKVTYKQAQRIAKAGSLSSITYDAVNSAIECASAFGISAATEFAMSLWNGSDFKSAMKQSISTGLDVYGSSFLVSLISSQLSKSAIGTFLEGSSKAIINSFGGKTGNVLARMLDENVWNQTAKNHAAKLLRINMLADTVQFVVQSAPFITKTIRGRMSGAQLFKEMAKTGGGIAGGSAGWYGGAALGTLILPGVGTVIGGIAGATGGGYLVQFLADKVTGLFIEEDAEKMMNIITDQLEILAEEYLLNETEINAVADMLTAELTQNRLEDMFASSSRELFAREIILRPIIERVVDDREQIDLPSDEEFSNEMMSLIENADVE